mmetsp:Transcript_25347/g.22386  ORF Transcript_25347/g.22386 Transcript_25347/m.22386 type:complete len:292 (+) Transcript_25347:23-898(+)
MYKSRGGMKTDPDDNGSPDEGNPFATNTKELTEDEIPDYIQTLEDHQKLCEKEGRYVEADMAKTKIEQMKLQLESIRKSALKERHIQEKLELEEAHVAEFNQFNEFWDKKMQEFNDQAQVIEEQMIQRHQEEMKKFLEELEMTISTRPRDSAELLNMRRIQENLAKQKEYIEAHKVQQKCYQLEKQEADKWQNNRESKMKHQRSQLQTRQDNELNALRKRIIAGQEEQRKARSIELQRLLQKYQNVKKELENQQQIELLRVTKNAKANGGSLFKSQQMSKMGRTGENFKRN